MPKWEQFFKGGSGKVKTAESSAGEIAPVNPLVAVPGFVPNPELEKIITQIRCETVHGYGEYVSGSREESDKRKAKAQALLERHKDQLMAYLEPYRAYVEEYFAKRNSSLEIAHRNQSLSAEENARFLIMCQLLRE